MFVPKTPSWLHQSSSFDLHKDDPYFALFWEMSLGKTKVLLDVAAYRFLDRRDIQALLIIAPNSVYPNWTSIEAPIHLAAPYVSFRYRPGSNDEKRIRRVLFLDPREIDPKRRLRLVAMSYDALCTDDGEAFAKRMVEMYPTMMVLDESSAIKNRETKRAKTCKFIGQRSVTRWIASGTPAVQSPFDLHSQIEFLDPDFWKRHGLKSWSAFKQEFGVYETQRLSGGRTFAKVTGYKSLRQLREIIAPISSRLVKEDSEVRLPPKIYTTRTFEMHPKQRDVYEQMAKNLIAEIDADPVQFARATFATTKSLRLQQISSGFVGVEEELDIDAAESFEGIDRSTSPSLLQDSWNEGDPGQKDDSEYASAISMETIEHAFEETMKEPKPSVIGLLPSSIEYFAENEQKLREMGADEFADQVVEMHEGIKAFKVERKIVDIIPRAENPRLLLLQEILEACEPKKAIVFCRFTHDVEMICDMLGEQALRYDGSTSQKLREANLEKFRDPNAAVARVLVANVHALSMGLTLTIAKLAIYFSNSFSLEKRLQSEDRIHRPGQDTSVQIIDLVAENSYDERIVQALREKYDIAAEVTGDRLREWIVASLQKAES